ncbi:hypothetical protein ACWEWX_04805 [Streptomyces asiaticus]
MGDGDKDTAAARLRLLQEATAPGITPRRPTGTRRTPPGSPPGAPIDLGMLDYMAACRNELVTHTRTQAPTAGAAPADTADLYEWMYQQTAHLAAEKQLVRDAMVIRQSLEHAIAAGDEDAVRYETCPACNCWSLLWKQARRAALCANRRCTDDNGLPHWWRLNQIAEHHVMAESSRSRAAT